MGNVNIRSDAICDLSRNYHPVPGIYSYSLSSTLPVCSQLYRMQGMGIVNSLFDWVSVVKNSIHVLRKRSSKFFKAQPISGED